MGYYAVIYEENQTGYLLNTFHHKLHALELIQSILDDFSTNNYVLSVQVFVIQEKFRVNRAYNIITHKKNIISSQDYKVLFKLELNNSFLYHIETNTEEFDVEHLPRTQDETVKYISKNFDEEITIGLN